MDTFYGKYSKGKLTLIPSRKILNCIPYSYNKNAIEGKEGFFNLDKLGGDYYSIETHLLLEDLSPYHQGLLYHIIHNDG